jgi:hypothetical protein
LKSTRHNWAINCPRFSFTCASQDGLKDKLMLIPSAGCTPHFGSAYRIQNGHVPNGAVQREFPDASWAYTDDHVVPGNRMKTIVPVGRDGQVARIEASKALDPRIEAFLNRLGVRYEKIDTLALWLQHLGKELKQSPAQDTGRILDDGARRITRRMRDYEDPQWEASRDEVQHAADEAGLADQAVDVLMNAFQRVASN